MAETLEELLVAINASTDKLRAELNQGNRSVAGFERNVNKRLDRVDQRFTKLGSSLRTALGAFGATLSVAGLTRFTQSALAAGDAIGKAAATAGIGAERLQELRFAFGQLAGTTDNEVDQSIRRFNRRLGLAIQGTGEAKKTFADLGITFRDASGQLRSTDDVLEEAIRKLAEIDNSAVRAARASQIFGEDAGPRLAAALGEGIDAMEQLRDVAPGVLSDEQVAKAEALTDAFDRMAKTVSGTLKGAFIDASDALARFFEVPEAFRTPEQVESRIENLQDRLKVLQQDLEQPVRIGRFLGGSGKTVKQLTEEIKAVNAEIDSLRKKQASLDDSTDDPAVDTTQFVIKDIAGPKEDEPLATVRVGPNLFPNREEFAAVEEQLRDLEESALRSQDRAAEAIRLAADRQIEQWQRVAEETPAFAQQAATAIELINEKAAGDIERLTDDVESQFDQLAGSIGFSLQSEFSNALQGIDSSFSDLLRKIAADFASSQILSFLSGFVPGSFGTSLRSALPGFANGGRPTPGMPGMFGERGPEAWIPDVSGRVLTAAQTERMMRGGGGGVQVNIQNPPVPATARQRNVGGTQVVDIVFQPIMDDLANNGPLSQALGAKFGISPAFGR